MSGAEVDEPVVAVMSAAKAMATDMNTSDAVEHTPVYKGKVAHRSWQQLPEEIVRLIATHFLWDISTTGYCPQQWEIKRQWYSRMAYTVVRDTIELEKYIMSVCPEWRKAVETHLFWNQAINILDPNDFLLFHMTMHPKPPQNASMNTAHQQQTTIHLTPYHHLRNILNSTCFVCRINYPLSNTGLANAKRLIPHTYLGPIPICRDHDRRKTHFCWLCLRDTPVLHPHDTSSRDWELAQSIAVVENEDEEMWPGVKATCRRCRTEWLWRKVSANPRDVEAIGGVAMQSKDWETRQNVEGFLELAEGTITDVILMAREKFWLRRNTKYDSLGQHLLAAQRSEPRHETRGLGLAEEEEEEEEEEDDDSEEDRELMLMRGSSQVRDLALQDWCRQRILDGYWTSPADDWFRNTVPGQPGVVPTVHPCPWAREVDGSSPASTTRTAREQGEEKGKAGDGAGDVSHPLESTIHGETPPTFALAEQAFNVHLKQLREILGPALRNVVRKIVMECSVYTPPHYVRSENPDGSGSGEGEEVFEEGGYEDPIRRVQGMEVEEVVRILREEEGVWYEGVDWLEKRRNEMEEREARDERRVRDDIENSKVVHRRREERDEEETSSGASPSSLSTTSSSGSSSGHGSGNSSHSRGLGSASSTGTSPVLSTTTLQTTPSPPPVPMSLDELASGEGDGDGDGEEGATPNAAGKSAEDEGRREETTQKQKQKGKAEESGNSDSNRTTEAQEEEEEDPQQTPQASQAQAQSQSQAQSTQQPEQNPTSKPTPEAKPKPKPKRVFLPTPRTIPIDPVRSPPRLLSKIPYVPVTTRHLPQYSLEALKAAWRDACTPLYHCRCSVCERAKIAELNARAAAQGYHGAFHTSVVPSPNQTQTQTQNPPPIRNAPAHGGLQPTQPPTLASLAGAISSLTLPLRTSVFPQNIELKEAEGGRESDLGVEGEEELDYASEDLEYDEDEDDEDDYEDDDYGDGDEEEDGDGDGDGGLGDAHQGVLLYSAARATVSPPPPLPASKQKAASVPSVPFPPPSSTTGSTEATDPTEAIADALGLASAEPRTRPRKRSSDELLDDTFDATKIRGVSTTTSATTTATAGRMGMGTGTAGSAGEDRDYEESVAGTPPKRARIVGGDGEEGRPRSLSSGSSASEGEHGQEHERSRYFVQPPGGASPILQDQNLKSHPHPHPQPHPQPHAHPQPQPPSPSRMRKRNSEELEDKDKDAQVPENHGGKRVRMSPPPPALVLVGSPDSISESPKAEAEAGLLTSTTAAALGASGGEEVVRPV